MKRFKPLTAAAAALLAVAAPAYAAKGDAAKGDMRGEVTLHIEADAAIAPDRADRRGPPEMCR